MKRARSKRVAGNILDPTTRWRCAIRVTFRLRYTQRKNPATIMWATMCVPEPVSMVWVNEELCASASIELLFVGHYLVA